ncbi:MAG: sigma-70 family RNA polymerase sigma factor [Dorea sp.]|nr:sigma-70 family RNA polymerase sigma factor [Dorea sp.]
MQDFEKVYVEYLRDVYNFLLKLSGSEDIAEELTQSTFSIAFENMEKFRGTCKISVWLCQIAKHEYFAHCRKQKHIVGETAGGEPWEESLEEKFIDHAEQIRIHEILHVLPEPYKEVFTLRVMAELSYKDISRLFGKSESWARVTYYRAKCMIIEQL